MGTRGTQQQRRRRGSTLYEPVEDRQGYPASPGGYPGYQYADPYADQYVDQYPGATAHHTGYHTAARQPLAQARAQMATQYAEAVAQDPTRSGTRGGSRAQRAQRAWSDGELSGGSDVSLPRIRVAPGEPEYDLYGTPPQQGRSGAAWGQRAPGRRYVTAAPVTREQRTAVNRVANQVVIEQPWSETAGGDEAGLVAVDGTETLDDSGVREFTRELDALISATSAQQRVVLPKGGKKATRRLGVVATLGVRAGVAFLILVGIMSGITALTGHPPIPNLPLPLFGATDAGAMAQFGVDANLLTRIQPLTQLKRSDQYDNANQFHAWGGSACSAAVLAETLTAYGVPNATIGHMIDELGSNISQQWGLVSYNGFADVAAKHGLRADMYVDHPLTYAQMLYLTNTLHVPLIVNVRATSGYYHYLDGGHFLVMTGGDAQTVRLVDSSEYYIKSLSYATFMGMYRNRSVAIVPKDFQYTLPA